MNEDANRPMIIQGGMGVAVSSWEVANTVARNGEMGVVSGTALDTVVVRELQEGDPHGRRRVLRDYPDQQYVQQILNRYYVDGGKAEDEPYDLLPIHRFNPTVESQKILSLAAFTEVKLAAQGHDGCVGINFLAKLKRFNLAAMYGAMLAGVDAILMGAGIPNEEARQVPRLVDGETARLTLRPDTTRAPDDGESHTYEFSPEDILPEPPQLDAPEFYPIIASDSLAKILDHKTPEGCITGWIVEDHVAGGHNAPPRNKQTDDRGNPVYDERDRVDLKRIRDLGYPFYLAGGYGTPEKLREARDRGAAGIQVGSLFSLTRESGYPVDTSRRLLQEIRDDEVTIRTDGRASPTGFPFKVVETEGTLAEESIYQRRRRICDLGYLREPYVDSEGRLRGRCRAEPVEDYVKKGGAREETRGRQCLCNGLLSNVGLGQIQSWGEEQPLYTAGDQFDEFPLESFDELPYSATRVLDYLKEEKPE